jgi:hypothetical protein
MKGASLTGTGDGTVLALDGAKITGHVFFDDEFNCAGQIRALGAEIGGQLSMSGATLTHTGTADPALLLNQVAINGDVFFNDRFSCAGQIRMINTRILGALLDTAAAWPAGLNLSGCAYQIYIDTTGLEHSQWEPKARIEWLARMAGH